MLTLLPETSAVSAPGQAPPSPPPSLVLPVRETIHGRELTDNYRWLEDQDSPQTRAWINAQIRYTEAELAGWPNREKTSARLGQLLKVDVVGTPVEAGGRYFYSRRNAEQVLAVIAMRAGPIGPETVLVDPHTLSPDQSVSVSLLDVSADGRLIAYGVRTGGEDELVVRFLDVDSRKELDDRLPRGRYSSVQIAPDRRGVFFARHDRTAGPRLFYHSLPPSHMADVLLFGDKLGPEKILGASLAEDGRRLIITVHHGAGGHRADVYLADVASRDGLLERSFRATAVVNDLDANFSADLAGDVLVLTTNWKAPRGRVLAVSLSGATPAKRDDWRELIPEHPTAVLRGVSAVGGKLVANYLDNVSSRLRVFTRDGRHDGEIALPTLGTAGGLSGRWSSPEAFWSFTSWVHPGAVYRYDVGTGESQVWFAPQLPIDPAGFEVRQVFFESRDQTRVPMFIVARKGVLLDGANPTLLTGYGGFNISRTPGFSALAATWVEAGGVYAVANIRGGGEFGEDWHRAGMLDKKQNSFDDFLAAAEYLHREKWTNPNRLAIAGASNGGLLVGAALTQRPDLFAAVVCGVPLLDMVRYHKFLVARFWIPEYGSSDDKAQFEYLLRYSPYHNVRPGTLYPAVMFVTGDADTRVDPLHARKMCALLQAATASDRPVLLHYDIKSGHSGGKPITKVIADTTDELAFLWSQLGRGPTQPKTPAGAHPLSGTAGPAETTVPARAIPPGGNSPPGDGPSPMAKAPALLKPPPTVVKPVTETIHGVSLTDPYRWLEDQDAPATRAWLAEQTKYRRALLDGRPGRADLIRRLEDLRRIDSYGSPAEAGGRYFFTRRLAGQELSSLCMRDRFDGPDRVLMDPITLAADGRINVAFEDIAHDGSLVVYGVKQGGEDESRLVVLEVASGKIVDERLPRARYGSVALRRDRAGFFYSRMLSDGTTRVYYHKLGADPASDPLVFGEGYKPEQYVDVALSEDGRRLVYSVSTGWDRVELFVQDVNLTNPVLELTRGVSGKFDLRICGDVGYLFTDWGAPRGRIMSIDFGKPARDNWELVVPEADQAIESFATLGGKLYVQYLRDCSSAVRVFDADGRPLGELKLPGIGSLTGLSGRWDSSEAFWGFTSFLTPRTLYRLDTRTDASTTWFAPKVPFDAGGYTVRLVRARSRDGTLVPVFLVHRRDLKPDGSNPTLLTGYGGFNVSMTPYFSTDAVIWVEAGGVYAVACLRGGGEFGEAWHQAGMRDKKQNVFDDFLAAAEHIIGVEKLTRPERLSIMGGSNGGLLVGAALTQRPDLFAAVVCEVPLLDMVRYHKFLLGPLWVPEYGSSDDKAQFEYLLRYSPYHNVKPGTRYPAVLFVTGDSDTRVAPLHARKMCALLQAATGSDAPIVLHYDTESGHAGEKPLAKQIAEQADTLSFLLWRLGQEK